LRLLALPEEMLIALAEHRITEGHTRPLLMLADRTAEQTTLFKEIMFKKLNVREAEQIARRIATEKVRKHSLIDPEVAELEQELTEKLGTRVQIEKREVGGKIVIDFFSNDDVRNFLKRIHKEMQALNAEGLPVIVADAVIAGAEAEEPAAPGELEEAPAPNPDEDLYFVKNFSL